MNKQHCTIQGSLCKHYKSDRCMDCKRAYKDLYEKTESSLPKCPTCKTNESVGIEKGDNYYWCIACMERFYSDNKRNPQESQENQIHLNP